MKQKKLIRATCIMTFIFCMNLLLTSCSPKEYGYTVKKTTVCTPKGTDIVGGNVSELTKEDIKYLNGLVKDNFPNATKKREPTNCYNCHSYAWYSQSENNKLWIGLEIDGVSYMGEQKKYWKDGSYVKITSGKNDTIPSTVPNGSKVNYVNDDHSAIKTSDKKFTSKWGAGGLYEHSPSYCPYTSTSLDYYKYYKN